MAKVLTVASGKGGVGKTSISLNLSLALAKAGYRVCLFDADLGLANVNILTGLYPEYGLAEILTGEKKLAEIMIRNFNGIDIIPGSSGVEKLADLTASQAERMIRGFLELPDYDYFILDTSAGISAQVLAFCRTCHEMILVATTEPTSLTDAYSLLKVLARSNSMPRIRVVINQVQSAEAAKLAYSKLKKTVQKFLAVKLAPLGVLVKDPNVPIAVVSQIPFMKLFPDTPASRCVRAMALKLVKNPGEGMPVEAFWDQCLDFLNRKRPHTDASPASQSGKDSDAQRQALESRLGTIEDKMGRLLDEMREVKEMLGRHPEPAETPPPAASVVAEPHVFVPVPMEPPPESVEETPQPSPIELDFEGWLAGNSKIN
ncbi:MAG: MinD/ParA family protein [Desulfobacter sp.]|nr:MAG: MinD/ParA family protein [Desulfobacter sp.]